MPCFSKKTCVQQSSGRSFNPNSTSSTSRFTFRFLRSILPLQYRALRRGRRHYQEDRTDSAPTPKFSDVLGARRNCSQTYDAPNHPYTAVSFASTDSRRSSKRSLSRNISEYDSQLQSDIHSQPHFNFLRTSPFQKRPLGDCSSSTDPIVWTRSAPQFPSVRYPTDHLTPNFVSAHGGSTTSNSAALLNSFSSASLPVISSMDKQTQDKPKRLSKRSSRLGRSATFPLISRFKNGSSVSDAPSTSSTSLPRRTMPRDPIVVRKSSHPNIHRNITSGDSQISRSSPKNDTSPAGPTSPYLAENYDESAVPICRENDPYICSDCTAGKVSNESKQNGGRCGMSENTERLKGQGPFVSVERERDFAVDSCTVSPPSLQEFLEPDSTETSDTALFKSCAYKTVSRALSFSNAKLEGDYLQDKLTNKAYVNGCDNYSKVMTEAYTFVSYRSTKNAIIEME